MKKIERDRKDRLRESWRASHNHHGLSYPMWLEWLVDSDSRELRFMNAKLWHQGRRLDACLDYVRDCETGMRIVERCARGTIGCKTHIPSLTSSEDGEAVAAAIVSLYRMLRRVKDRVMEVSEAEKEAARAHNEAIRAHNAPDQR